MKKLFTISICIPTYSRPKELASILSELTRIVKNHGNVIEIFVLDDNPKENVKSVVKTFKSKLIRYEMNDRNIGLDKNFVKLMKRAKGDYILFLTDDDIFTENALFLLTEAIERHPKTSVFTGAREIYQNGKLIRIEKVLKKNTKIENNDYFHLSRVIYDANVLSGLCLKRSDIKYQDHEKFYGSLFSHLHIVALTGLKDGVFYISSPLVKHTIENIVYWKYSDDYYLVEKFSISDSIANYNAQLGEEIRNRFLNGIAYIMYMDISKGKLPKAVLKVILKSNLFSLQNLYQIMSGVVYELKKKIAYKV